MGGSIRLSPEVIAARVFARAEQEAKPISEVIKDIQQERVVRNDTFIAQISQKKNK